MKIQITIDGWSHTISLQCLGYTEDAWCDLSYNRRHYILTRFAMTHLIDLEWVEITSQLKEK
jgi:hypothetical protein